MKPKLLLHICCAPDLTVVAERLGDDYQLGAYFYNPNIHPRTEYLKRVEELELLAPKFGVARHAAPYDPLKWFEAIKEFEDEPEGGERCKICFKERLNRTALAAKELGYDLFGSVLTVSPHKNAELINNIGREIAAKVKISYYESNFKKNDGFKRSIELSRQYKLYRQDYCGCIYSQKDREIQRSIKSKR